jgi:hypothetical protein
MLGITVFLTLFLCLMPSVYGRENLTREITFENGLEGLALNADGARRSAVIVNNPSRAGGKSLKTDRPAGSQNRMEMVDTPGRPPLHKEIWYGWSVRVDINDNPNRLNVNQIHHHQGHAGNRENQLSIRSITFEY